MKEKKKDKKIFNKAIASTVTFSMLANPVYVFAEGNTITNNESSIVQEENQMSKDASAEENTAVNNESSIVQEENQISNDISTEESTKVNNESSIVEEENQISNDASAEGNIEVNNEGQIVKEESQTTNNIISTTEKAKLSIEQLVQEMQYIKYEDLYTILNPRVSAIDKINIETALTKELGRTPTQDELDARIKQVYMEKLGLKESFETVSNNLATTISEIFRNTQNPDVQIASQNKISILLALTYLERQYSFSFGDKIAKELIIYKDNIDTLYRLIGIGANLDYFSLDLSRNVETYQNKLAGITGYGTPLEFIEENVATYVSGKTPEQWFKETTKATVVETTSHNGDTSLFNKFKTDNVISRHLIPLLTLSENNLYALSSTSSVTYGLVDSYVDKTNVDGTKDKFLADLKATGKKQQDFLDFWFRISDKKDILKNGQNVVVIDTMKRYGDEQVTPSSQLWFDETGANSSTGIKEFISPFRYYSTYLRVDAEASGQMLIKFFQSRALNDYGATTYTHEMTHLLDEKVWMDGKKRRIGQGGEVFARGLFEVANNTPGISSYNPFFNLNLAFDLGDNRIQNKNPDRFQKESDLKEYMQGVMDVVYTLDYMEAKSSLARSNAEKTILFNQLELTPDNNRQGQVQDTFKNIDEATAEKLITINDLIDHNISSGRLTYEGFQTIGTVRSNGYHIAPMFEPIFAAVQNPTGSAGDISFRRYAFDMLAEYGYKDGMIPYISNQYDNDTIAFNNILTNYNGDFTAFKKDMFKRRIDNIKNLKENDYFSTPEELQSKMDEAVAKDLEIMQQNKKYGNFITINATNVRDLKTKVFQSYLKSTDDFRTSIYKTEDKATIYEPSVSSGDVKYTTKTSIEDAKKLVLDKVTVPTNAGKVQKEIIDTLPTTSGTYDVKVKVTYDDGSFDEVSIKIVVSDIEIVPFKTTYIADDTLEKGFKVTATEGVNGEMIDGIITLNPINKVVRVGTKPTIVTEEIPFEIKRKPNPEMYEDDKEKVITEGIVGIKEITTTYTVDKNTGEVKANAPIEKVTREKVDRVIEYGTKKKDTIEEIQFTIEYVADETLDKGVREVKTAGVKGEKVNGVVVKEPINEVVRVGTKSTIVTEEIPFEIKRKPNPEMYEDDKEKVITEGIVGIKEITTTYTVDKNTGEVKANAPIEKVTREKVDRVIEYGTKKKDTIEDSGNILKPETPQSQTQSNSANQDNGNEGIDNTNGETQSNNGTKHESLPQTGYNSNTMIYSVLALLSGLMMFILPKKKKKDKEALDN